MATCDYDKQLSGYHDGELSLSERVAFKLHLVSCMACATELESLRNLSLILQDAEPVSRLRAEALVRCHREVDAWSLERRDHRLMRIARALTAVAACLLVGAFAWGFGAKQSPAAQARPWEQVAVTLQTEIPTAGGTDLAADWVLADASKAMPGD